MNLKELLIKHEALKLTPYLDSEGILTVGVGRNLERPISNKLAMFMLDEDIESAKKDASNFEWFSELNETRQTVILDMLFNLGLSRFMGFKKTIKAINAGEYLKASQEMLDSKWARQVGHRAVELSMMMESGEDQNV